MALEPLEPSEVGMTVDATTYVGEIVAAVVEELHRADTVPRGPVAQWQSRGLFNPLVVGSNPTRLAIANTTHHAEEQPEGRRANRRLGVPSSDVRSRYAPLPQQATDRLSAPNADRVFITTLVIGFFAVALMLVMIYPHRCICSACSNALREEVGSSTSAATSRRSDSARSPARWHPATSRSQPSPSVPTPLAAEPIDEEHYMQQVDVHHGELPLALEAAGDLRHGTVRSLGLVLELIQSIGLRRRGFVRAPRHDFEWSQFFHGEPGEPGTEIAYLRKTERGRPIPTSRSPPAAALQRRPDGQSGARLHPRRSALDGSVVHPRIMVADARMRDAHHAYPIRPAVLEDLLLLWGHPAARPGGRPRREPSCRRPETVAAPPRCPRR